jgi:hypothetical protein
VIALNEEPIEKQILRFAQDDTLESGVGRERSLVASLARDDNETKTAETAETL